MKCILKLSIVAMIFVTQVELATAANAEGESCSTEDASSVDRNDVPLTCMKKNGDGVLVWHYDKPQLR